MSQRQSDAIRQWWSERKAAGWTYPLPKQTADERRVKDRERRRRKYATKREEILAAQRAAYASKRDAMNVRRRANRAANAEKYREADSQRRRSDGDRMRAQSRERYSADPTAKREAIKRWRDKNREHVNANAMRRHALKLRTKTGPVNYDAVIEASEGMCGICGKPVDLVVRKNYNIDHVIPLARGGTHTQDNLQLAHKLCNVKKWAHLPYTGAPAAMGAPGGMIQ